MNDWSGCSSARVSPMHDSHAVTPDRNRVRVAVVTGAGRGLGQAYATDLAAHGFSLVLNDIDLAAAEETAARCRSVGTPAVTDGSAVGAAGSAQSVVDLAHARFGRLDTLVCNAGVVRDRTVANLSDSDVEVVLSVHLRGTIDLIRAAWASMKERRHGRLVLVTSAAALFGNVGQSNYAAAKGGVIGLARALAREGERYDIRCNVVAPLAQTDMAGDLHSEVFSGLETRDVAPLVTYLSSGDCAVTGEVFGAGGGRFTRIALAETPGVRFPQGFTRDDIAARMPEIRDMDGCEFPDSLAEHLAAYIGARR